MVATYCVVQNLPVVVSVELEGAARVACGLNVNYAVQLV